jgi:CPA2 family monovalent cation:H+ antiporter-2
MDTNLDRILCAVDFSKFSKPIVDYATGIAQRTGAHVTVFHALGVQRAPIQGESGCRPEAAVKEQVSNAYARIETLMVDRPVRWDAVVRCGDAVDAIVDYSEANDVGLVLAASYGLSGWKRLLLGTVVEALSRSLSRPLLVVRAPRKKRAQTPDPQTLQLKNILVCCDLSASALSLYPYGERIARHFGSQLNVIHAMETPVQEDLVDPTTAPYAEVQHRLQAQLHERLRQQISANFPQGFPVSTAVIPGNPEDSLRDFAAGHAVDLIIVGVRPRGSFQKILIGSTTESMVRHAPCNVLTIPCGTGEK